MADSGLGSAIIPQMSFVASFISFSAAIASQRPPTWSMMPYFTAWSPSIIEPTSVASSSGRIISSRIFLGSALEWAQMKDIIRRCISSK